MLLVHPAWSSAGVSPWSLGPLPTQPSCTQAPMGISPHPGPMSFLCSGWSVLFPATQAETHTLKLRPTRLGVLYPSVAWKLTSANGIVGSRDFWTLVGFSQWEPQQIGAGDGQVLTTLLWPELLLGVFRPGLWKMLCPCPQAGVGTAPLLPTMSYWLLCMLWYRCSVYSLQPNCRAETCFLLTPD